MFDTLGFQQEARYHESHWTEAGWQDTLIYVRLVHDGQR